MFFLILVGAIMLGLAILGFVTDGEDSSPTTTQANEIAAAANHPSCAAIAGALAAQWQPGGRFYERLYHDFTLRTKIDQVRFYVTENAVVVTLDSTAPVGDKVYDLMTNSDWSTTIPISSLCGGAAIPNLSTANRQLGLKQYIDNYFVHNLGFRKENRILRNYQTHAIDYDYTHLWINW